MKRNLIILAAFILASTMFAQAQVGIGTTTPNASAALDVQSTTRGVLLPRMTSAQRIAIATPADGLIVYQTDAISGLWMRISGAWVRLTSANDLYGSSTGFAANTSGTVIAVVLGGTPVPLPNAQSLGSNVTVNGANNTFTVTQAGRYRLAYGINLTAGLLVDAQLVINGVANPATTVSPTLAVSRLSAEAIVTLTAGSTIQLQLTGLVGLATLLGSGQGAALTIQRVE